MLDKVFDLSSDGGTTQCRGHNLNGIDSTGSYYDGSMTSMETYTSIACPLFPSGS